MKKIIILFSLFAFTALTFNPSNAQTFARLKQGNAADTLKASTTYNNILNVNSDQLQTVSVQVFVDSVSGTPNGTATLYRSVDGSHWETTGQTETWITGIDTTFILTDSSFYGAYAKVAIVTTSTAQKSFYWLTLKAWKKD